MFSFIRNIQISSLTAALILFSGPSLAQSLDAVLDGLNTAELGEVEFATSCNPTAQPAFEIGLLLLHHMMYRQSASAFEVASKSDPDCAMAQWGIAMTKFHPLWPGGPSPEETEAGRAAIARLAEMDHGTPREAAFIEAAQAFYEGGDKTFRERLVAWSAKQRQIDDAFPDDPEATAFSALAKLTVAPRGPEAVPVLSDAGARMDVLRKMAPLHPASYHYAIHAYDHPALADRAFEIARGYDMLAPEVPHALHMPSHIFTRLGLWQESAAWNARSAAAVLAQSDGEVIADHYPHAMDYAVYAHLQAGDAEAAGVLLAELRAHENLEDSFGSAYAEAAAVARLPLEQDDWTGAAALLVDLNPAISWDRFPQAVAIRCYAKGIGAARAGDLAAAGDALAELAELGEVMEARELGYWLSLLEAQSKSIEAWIALSEGDTDRAVKLMREAADVEDMAGKAPVTPGHVLPARELLGYLLLEVGDAAGATEAYQAVLSVSPNRRRSLAGLSQRP